MTEFNQYNQRLSHIQELIEREAKERLPKSFVCNDYLKAFAAVSGEISDMGKAHIKAVRAGAGIMQGVSR